MITAKRDFILRKMLDAYMIIAVGDSADTFRSIIQTNETGAFLWKMLEKGTTFEDMVNASLERFEDLDEVTARRDITEFIASIDAAITKE